MNEFFFRNSVTKLRKFYADIQLNKNDLEETFCDIEHTQQDTRPSFWRTIEVGQGDVE